MSWHSWCQVLRVCAKNISSGPKLHLYHEAQGSLLSAGRSGAEERRGGSQPIKPVQQGLAYLREGKIVFLQHMRPDCRRTLSLPREGMSRDSWPWEAPWLGQHSGVDAWCGTAATLSPGKGRPGNSLEGIKTGLLLSHERACGAKWPSGPDFSVGC